MAVPPAAPVRRSEGVAARSHSDLLTACSPLHHYPAFFTVRHLSRYSVCACCCCFELRSLITTRSTLLAALSTHSCFAALTSHSAHYPSRPLSVLSALLVLTIGCCSLSALLAQYPQHSPSTRLLSARSPLCAPLSALVQPCATIDHLFMSTVKVSVKPNHRIIDHGHQR